MEEFREMIIRELKRRLGKEYQITSQDKCKNNGVNLHGISIHRVGDEVSPLIYMEEFILAYVGKLQSLEEIVDCIIEKCGEKNILQGMASHLKEFNMMKDKVRIRLINYDANAETLKHIPHRKFLDLAVTYYLDMGKARYGYNATAVIPDELTEIWKVSEEELYQTGMEKLLERDTFHAVDIISLIKEAAKEEQDADTAKLLNKVVRESKPGEKIYSVSNQKVLYGASCIINTPFLQELAEQERSDLIIYPYNVSELIIFPLSDRNKEEIAADNLMELYNRKIPREERLSNSVYLYDRKTHGVSIIKQGVPL